MDVLYIFVISPMQSTNIPRILCLYISSSLVRRNEVFLIIATDSVASILTPLARVM